MINCFSCNATNYNDAAECQKCNTSLSASNDLNKHSHSGEDMTQFEILKQLEQLNSTLSEINKGAKEGGTTSIRDIEMTFMSMVVFMIKWVIAMIPALIILSFIFLLFSMVVPTILVGMSRM